MRSSWLFLLILHQTVLVVKSLPRPRPQKESPGHVYKCAGSGVEADITNCSKYHQCLKEGESPVATLNCPSDSLFDTLEKNCQPKYLANCITCESDGFYKDNSSPFHYFECKGGAVEKHLCKPKGTVFNQEEQGCQTQDEDGQAKKLGEYPGSNDQGYHAHSQLTPYMQSDRFAAANDSTLNLVSQAKAGNVKAGASISTRNGTEESAYAHSQATIGGTKTSNEIFKGLGSSGVEYGSVHAMASATGSGKAKEDALPPEEMEEPPAAKEFDVGSDSIKLGPDEVKISRRRRSIRKIRDAKVTEKKKVEDPEAFIKLGQGFNEKLARTGYNHWMPKDRIINNQRSNPKLSIYSKHLYGPRALAEDEDTATESELEVKHWLLDSFLKESTPEHASASVEIYTPNLRNLQTKMDLIASEGAPTVNYNMSEEYRNNVKRKVESESTMILEQQAPGDTKGVEAAPIQGRAVGDTITEKKVNKAGNNDTEKPTPASPIEGKRVGDTKTGKKVDKSGNNATDKPPTASPVQGRTVGEPKKGKKADKAGNKDTDKPKPAKPIQGRSVGDTKTGRKVNKAANTEGDKPPDEPAAEPPPPAAAPPADPTPPPPPSSPKKHTRRYKIIRVPCKRKDGSRSLGKGDHKLGKPKAGKPMRGEDIKIPGKSLADDHVQARGLIGEEDHPPIESSELKSATHAEAHVTNEPQVSETSYSKTNDIGPSTPKYTSDIYLSTPKIRTNTTVSPAVEDESDLAGKHFQVNGTEKPVVLQASTSAKPSLKITPPLYATDTYPSIPKVKPTTTASPAIEGESEISSKQFDVNGTKKPVLLEASTSTTPLIRAATPTYPTDINPSIPKVKPTTTASPAIEDESEITAKLFYVNGTKKPLVLDASTSTKPLIRATLPIYTADIYPSISKVKPNTTTSPANDDDSEIVAKNFQVNATKKPAMLENVPSKTQRANTNTSTNATSIYPSTPEYSPVIFTSSHTVISQANSSPDFKNETGLYAKKSELNEYHITVKREVPSLHITVKREVGDNDPTANNKVTAIPSVVNPEVSLNPSLTNDQVNLNPTEKTRVNFLTTTLKVEDSADLAANNDKVSTEETAKEKPEDGSIAIGQGSDVKNRAEQPITDEQAPGATEVKETQSRNLDEPAQKPFEPIDLPDAQPLGKDKSVVNITEGSINHAKDEPLTTPKPPEDKPVVQEGDELSAKSAAENAGVVQSPVNKNPDETTSNPSSQQSHGEISTTKQQARDSNGIDGPAKSELQENQPQDRSLIGEPAEKPLNPVSNPPGQSPVIETSEIKEPQVPVSSNSDDKIPDAIPAIQSSERPILPNLKNEDNDDNNAPPASNVTTASVKPENVGISESSTTIKSVNNAEQPDRALERNQAPGNNDTKELELQARGMIENPGEKSLVSESPQDLAAIEANETSTPNQTKLVENISSESPKQDTGTNDLIPSSRPNEIGEVISILATEPPIRAENNGQAPEKNDLNEVQAQSRSLIEDPKENSSTSGIPQESKYASSSTEATPNAGNTLDRANSVSEKPQENTNPNVESPGENQNRAPTQSGVTIKSEIVVTSTTEKPVSSSSGPNKAEEKDEAPEKYDMIQDRGLIEDSVDKPLKSESLVDLRPASTEIQSTEKPKYSTEKPMTPEKLSETPLKNDEAESQPQSRGLTENTTDKKSDLPLDMPPARFSAEVLLSTEKPKSTTEQPVKTGQRSESPVESTGNENPQQSRGMIQDPADTPLKSESLVDIRPENQIAEVVYSTEQSVKTQQSSQPSVINDVAENPSQPRDLIKDPADKPLKSGIPSDTPPANPPAEVPPSTEKPKSTTEQGSEGPVKSAGNENTLQSRGLIEDPAHTPLKFESLVKIRPESQIEEVVSSTVKSKYSMEQPVRTEQSSEPPVKNDTPPPNSPADVIPSTEKPKSTTDQTVNRDQGSEAQIKNSEKPVEIPPTSPPVELIPSTENPKSSTERSVRGGKGSEAPVINNENENPQLSRGLISDTVDTPMKSESLVNMPPAIPHIELTPSTEKPTSKKEGEAPGTTYRNEIHPHSRSLIEDASEIPLKSESLVDTHLASPPAVIIPSTEKPISSTENPISGKESEAPGKTNGNEIPPQSPGLIEEPPLKPETPAEIPPASQPVELIPSTENPESSTERSVRGEKGVEATVINDGNEIPPQSRGLIVDPSETPIKSESLVDTPQASPPAEIIPSTEKSKSTTEKPVRTENENEAPGENDWKEDQSQVRGLNSESVQIPLKSEPQQDNLPVHSSQEIPNTIVTSTREMPTEMNKPSTENPEAVGKPGDINSNYAIETQEITENNLNPVTVKRDVSDKPLTESEEDTESEYTETNTNPTPTKPMQSVTPVKQDTRVSSSNSNFFKIPTTKIPLSVNGRGDSAKPNPVDKSPQDRSLSADSSKKPKKSDGMQDSMELLAGLQNPKNANKKNASIIRPTTESPTDETDTTDTSNEDDTSDETSTLPPKPTKTNSQPSLGTNFKSTGPSEVSKTTSGKSPQPTVKPIVKQVQGRMLDAAPPDKKPEKASGINSRKVDSNEEEEGVEEEEEKPAPVKPKPAEAPAKSQPSPQTQANEPPKSPQNTPDEDPEATTEVDPFMFVVDDPDPNDEPGKILHAKRMQTITGDELDETVLIHGSFLDGGDYSLPLRNQINNELTDVIDATATEKIFVMRKDGGSSNITHDIKIGAGSNNKQYDALNAQIDQQRDEKIGNKDHTEYWINDAHIIASKNKDSQIYKYYGPIKIINVTKGNHVPAGTLAGYVGEAHASGGNGINEDSHPEGQQNLIKVVFSNIHGHRKKTKIYKLNKGGYEKPRWASSMAVAGTSSITGEKAGSIAGAHAQEADPNSRTKAEASAATWRGGSGALSISSADSKSIHMNNKPTCVKPPCADGSGSTAMAAGWVHDSAGKRTVDGEEEIIEETRRRKNPGEEEVVERIVKPRKHRIKKIKQVEYSEEVEEPPQEVIERKTKIPVSESASNRLRNNDDNQRENKEIVVVRKVVKKPTEVIQYQETRPTGRRSKSKRRKKTGSGEYYDEEETEGSRKRSRARMRDDDDMDEDLAARRSRNRKKNSRLEGEEEDGSVVRQRTKYKTSEFEHTYEKTNGDSENPGPAARPEETRQPGRTRDRKRPTFEGKDSAKKDPFNFEWDKGFGKSLNTGNESPFEHSISDVAQNVGHEQKWETGQDAHLTDGAPVSYSKSYGVSNSSGFKIGMTTNNNGNASFIAGKSEAVAKQQEFATDERMGAKKHLKKEQEKRTQAKEGSHMGADGAVRNFTDVSLIHAEKTNQSERDHYTGEQLDSLHEKEIHHNNNTDHKQSADGTIRVGQSEKKKGYEWKNATYLSDDMEHRENIDRKIESERLLAHEKNDTSERRTETDKLVRAESDAKSKNDLLRGRQEDIARSLSVSSDTQLKAARDGEDDRIFLTNNTYLTDTISAKNKTDELEESASHQKSRASEASSSLHEINGTKNVDEFSSKIGSDITSVSNKTQDNEYLSNLQTSFAKHKDRKGTETDLGNNVTQAKYNTNEDNDASQKAIFVERANNRYGEPDTEKIIEKSKSKADWSKYSSDAYNDTNSNFSNVVSAASGNDSFTDEESERFRILSEDGGEGRKSRRRGGKKRRKGSSTADEYSAYPVSEENTKVHRSRSSKRYKSEPVESEVVYEEEVDAPKRRSRERGSRERSRSKDRSPSRERSSGSRERKKGSKERGSRERKRKPPGSETEYEYEEPVRKSKSSRRREEITESGPSRKYGDDEGSEALAFAGGGLEDGDATAISSSHTAGSESESGALAAAGNGGAKVSVRLKQQPREERRSRSKRKRVEPQAEEDLYE